MKKYKALTGRTLFLLSFVLLFFLLEAQITKAATLCNGFINCCWGSAYCCDGINIYPYCGALGVCVTEAQYQCPGCPLSGCDTGIMVNECTGDGGTRCDSGVGEPDPGPGCTSTGTACCPTGDWENLYCAEEGDGTGCDCDQMFQYRESGCTYEYRCVDNASCTCGGTEPTNTPIPTLGPSPTPGIPPVCTITGDTSVCLGDIEDYTSSCTVGGSTTNVAGTRIHWNITSGPITWAAAGGGDWTDQMLCDTLVLTTTGAASCTGSKFWNTTGSYYVAALGWAAGYNLVDGLQCSANPWCEWPPVTDTGDELTSCGPRWVDCTSNDLLTVTVASVNSPSNVITSTTCPSNDPTITTDWGAGQCNSIYDVQRCTGNSTTCNAATGSWSSVASDISATVWADSTVSAGTSYCYRVRGQNGTAVSGWVYPTCRTVTVSPPANVTTAASCPSNDPTITTDWDAASCCSIYDVQRCTGNSTTCNATTGSWSSVASDISATVWADSTVNAGTSYCYRVRGQNGTAVSGWVYPTCRTVTIPIPIAPTLDDDCLITPVSVDVAWGAIGCVTGYRIYRCTGSACIPGLTNQIGSTTGTSFTDTTGVVHGTTYCYNIRGVNGTVVGSPSPTSCITIYCPSCTVTTDPLSTINIQSGQTTQSVAMATVVGSISTVSPSWSVSSPTLATLAPFASCVVSAPNVSCGVSITGEYPGTGTYSVSISIYDGIGTFTCTPNPVSGDLTVAPVTPWWQIMWGNVVTKGGVTSNIPGTAYNPYFITDPVGLLIYSSSIVPDFTPSGTVSPSRALINAGVTTRPEMSFDLLYNRKLPSDIRTETEDVSPPCYSNLYCSYHSNSYSMNQLKSCNELRGYKICYYDGDEEGTGTLTLTGGIVENGERQILFVENAVVTITGAITMQTQGTSSFLLISEEDINISPTVGGDPDGIPEIEGLFYTDGTFSSGHDETDGLDQQLHIRGSVAANQFSFVRNLGTGPLGYTNNQYPGEYFEYGTEQVLAFPPLLRLRTTSWSEVAP
jgi:hypothetical protein